MGGREIRSCSIKSSNRHNAIEETISLNGNYTGPVTILINNIKSSNVMTGGNPAQLSTPSNTTTAATAGNKGTTDSVRFTAKLT
jgi:hypothetical protein